MDWSVVHDLNELIRTHDLLEDPLTLFASAAVTIYAVATAALWFVSRPEGARRLRLACASALTAAAGGLLLNQAIGHFWVRERPFAAHPHSLVLFTAPSHDPSFPSDHATAADLHPRRPSWVPCAQLVARQPNLTSVGIGAPVLVEPIEISEPPGIVTVWVLVHPVLPGGTVQLSAVFALPTRTVNVRVSVRPVATVSVTARSRAVIVALAVNELKSPGRSFGDWLPAPEMACVAAARREMSPPL